MHHAGEFDVNTADPNDLVRPNACIDPKSLDLHSSGTVPQSYQEDPSTLLAILETLGSKDPPAFLAMFETLRSKVADGLPPTEPINRLPGPPQRSGFKNDFVDRCAASTRPTSDKDGVSHVLPYRPPFTLLGNSGKLPVDESLAGTME